MTIPAAKPAVPHDRAEPHTVTAPLVVGGSGGIGQAMIRHWLAQGLTVSVVTHRIDPSMNQLAHQYPGLRILCCDSSAYRDRLPEWLKGRHRPTQILHCNGFLHSGDRLPEKRLADVEESFLLTNFERNCMDALRLAQALESVFTSDSRFGVAILSARVGSISDNRLGGWYSYRMSKAALNMLIKTLALEWQRSFPGGAVIALHPGTTDTALSRPFQRHIPAGRLYTPEQTAKRITAILAQLSPEQSGRFLNWDGCELPW